MDLKTIPLYLIPCASEGDPLLGEGVHTVVVADDLLELLGADGEVLAGGPDVAVVAEDDGLLHLLGGEQLVVHVLLPAHRDGAQGDGAGGGAAHQMLELELELELEQGL